jgi:hypothetical protein
MIGGCADNILMLQQSILGVIVKIVRNSSGAVRQNHFLEIRLDEVLRNSRKGMS